MLKTIQVMKIEMSERDILFIFKMMPIYAGRSDVIEAAFLMAVSLNNAKSEMNFLISLNTWEI